MGSVFYGGKIRMEAVDFNENKSDDFYEYMDEYPCPVPKVFLEGYGETYFPQMCFDWSDDTIVMVRDDFIVEYTKSHHAELLAENEDGDIVWMDGRTAPYANCWNGKYLDEVRGAYGYRVVEYDLKSLEKKTYKVVLEKTSDFDVRDVDRIMERYGEEEFCRDFTIRDHKVHRRVEVNNDSDSSKV